MRQPTRVTVTMREPDRLKSIQAVMDGELKPILAAERLGLTSRPGDQSRFTVAIPRCEIWQVVEKMGADLWRGRNALFLDRPPGGGVEI